MKNFFHYFGVVFVSAILMHYLTNNIFLPLKWHSNIAVGLFVIVTSQIFKFSKFIQREIYNSDVYTEIHNSKFFTKRRNTHFERFAKKSSIRSLLEILILAVTSAIILRVIIYLMSVKQIIGLVLFAYFVAFIFHYSFSLCEMKYGSNFIEVKVKNFLKTCLQFFSGVVALLLVVASCYFLFKGVGSVWAIVIYAVVFILFTIKILIPAIIKTRRETRQENEE